MQSHIGRVAEARGTGHEAKGENWVEGQALQSHIHRAAGRGRKGVQFEDRNRSWLPRASRATANFTLLVLGRLSILATRGLQRNFARTLFSVCEDPPEKRRFDLVYYLV